MLVKTDSITTYSMEVVNKIEDEFDILRTRNALEFGDEEVLKEYTDQDGGIHLVLNETDEDLLYKVYNTFFSNIDIHKYKTLENKLSSLELNNGSVTFLTIASVYAFKNFVSSDNQLLMMKLINTLNEWIYS